MRSESINPYRTDVHRHGEHREIFNAIRDRDPEKTRKLAAEHIARFAEATKGWEKDYLERSKKKSGQLTP